jgi:hypothetical protein
MAKKLYSIDSRVNDLLTGNGALESKRDEMNYGLLNQLLYSSSYLGQYYLKSEVAKLLRTHAEKSSLRLIKENAQEKGKFIPIPSIYFQDLSATEIAAIQILIPDMKSPLIIKGVLKDTEAFKKWTPGYFSEHYGDSKVMVRTDTSVRKETSQQQSAEIFLKELVAKALAGDDNYYGGNLSDIFNDNPELRQDLGLDFISRTLMNRDAETFYTTQLFLGGGRTRTAFHCAGTQNLFFNIYGKKTWTFVSPKDTIAMYPTIRENALYFNSQVASDSDPRDNQDFPLFDYIDKYQATLEPGDILVSPEYWWHEVQNHGVTIGVANRYNGLFKGVDNKTILTRNLPRVLKSNPLFFMIAAMSKSTREIGSTIKKTGWGSDKTIAALIRK